MWDYTAFPLWCDADAFRRLHPEFRDAIQAWSDEGTERCSAQLDGQELPQGWVADWSRRGRDLATAASLVVCDVDYENEATGDTERVPSSQTAPGYATPGAAALSGYSPQARARVVSIEMISDWQATVVVDTEPRTQSPATFATTCAGSGPSGRLSADAG
jgi:hypothetical protein